jgi:hypothetical protein
MPLTIPFDVPIVATAGVLLDQMPPGVGSVKVAELPAHILDVPEIAPAATFIVTVVVADVVPQLLVTV